jgi:putative peptidoglycan lipid II flippase
LATETTPKSTQSVASATVLLMASAVLSGLLALIRIRYINVLFGAGVEQDAYRAAFKLPDLVSYFLVGSAASVSLITMLNRYRVKGDHDGANRALSVVLTTMLIVLSAAAVVAAALAPLYVRIAYPEFLHDARGPLCITLTRLLLPAQLFFFLGSMMSAHLQVRRIFLYQACTPVIYNGGIVLGAIFLHRQFGVYSLVIGVYAGVILGSAVLNSIGAFRNGLRLHPRVDFRDAAFLEWFRAALPLMLGVSVVMFDGIFFNRFASDRLGGVTLINTAKDLFNAPFNVIGPAAGAASLPFFAALYQQQRPWDFSVAVTRSVSRLFAVGLLVSAWMIALAPSLMDLFRGGRFNRADTAETTRLFVLFSLTLGLWAIQGIYARAFYAASDTRTPAIAGTTIVLLSAPLYWLFYRALGLAGLALASDAAILIQTATLAILLHKRRLVSLAQIEWPEIARALLAAIVAYVAALSLARALPPIPSYKGDILTIAAGSIAWAIAAYVILTITGSKLPAQVLRRKPPQNI